MSESTKKPEQAEENTTPETAPAEDTKKAEKPGNPVRNGKEISWQNKRPVPGWM